MTIPLREILSFVSARPSGFPEAKPRGTLRVMGKKTHCFTSVTPRYSKREQIVQPWQETLYAECVTWLDTNLPRFQGAGPAHVWFESSSFWFPYFSEFVHLWELDCFDTRHVTVSRPIEKRV